jgi:two-component system chemotaxis response regulator CheY
MAHYVCRVLENMGILPDNIDSAENGEQALHKVNDNYYDFIVSDYNMPVMDGMELLDRIRKESAQSSIPVLMVTSETDANRLAAVQQAGVSAICDKPFDPSSVRQLISQFVLQ